jgi:sortase A
MYADEIVDTTTVPSTEVVTSEAPTIVVPETTTAPTATTTTTTAPEILVDGSIDSESADALSRGWFSDLSAIPQTLLWGLLELLIVMGAWRVAKKFRNRIIGAAVGFIPFFVVLYFVFQNVNRLLPPNL